MQVHISSPRTAGSMDTFPMTRFTLLPSIWAALLPCGLHGAARVSEIALEMPTYGFPAPNPIPEPETEVSSQIWPYFKFEGYSAVSTPCSWSCVRLENDAISVDVFPEIGGKIWSAHDKQSGLNFIYRNNVVKFRNISTRGPWTSGGIEFNFGMLGHAPTASTPVDYAFRSNVDGSASCFIGVLELITRTRWCIEIRLGATDRFFYHTYHMVQRLRSTPTLLPVDECRLPLRRQLSLPRLRTAEPRRQS